MKNATRRKSKTSRGLQHSSVRISRKALTRKELEEMLTFSKGLARASGTLALSYYGRANPTLRYDHDLVTEADLVVQEYIRKEVKHSYFNHKFLGEESKKIEKNRDIQHPLWVVDPVDGSAAFSSGLPIWGVSIALFDGARPVLGVFYLPVTGELYSAVIGGKAMLNDRQIEVREEAVDNESLLLTYSRFHQDFRTYFPGKVRSLGSTAAHIAYVARGAACGAILGNVHVWDVASGLVILEAAGGTIRDLAGHRVDLVRYLGGDKIDQVLVASARGQHKEISDTLQAQ